MIILTGLDAEKRKQSALNIAYDLLCVSKPHPDIHWVTHEKERSISVGEIRTQVCDDVYVRPFKAERKVYIIDDAELMTPQAQNALLKTLEEPPEYAFIILLTANENLLLDTIKSRCNIRRIDGEEEIDSDSDRVKYARTLYHDVLVFKACHDESRIVLKEEMDRIKELSRSKDYDEIGNILDIIDRTDDRLRVSVNPEISLAIMEGKI